MSHARDTGRDASGDAPAEAAAATAREEAAAAATTTRTTTSTTTAVAGKETSAARARVVGGGSGSVGVEPECVRSREQLERKPRRFGFVAAVQRFVYLYNLYTGHYLLTGAERILVGAIIAGMLGVMVYKLIAGWLA